MNVLFNKHDVDVLADLGLPSRGSAILNVHHTLFWRGAIRNPDRELLTLPLTLQEVLWCSFQSNTFRMVG